MVIGTATGLGAVTVGITDSTTTQEQLLGFNVLILDSATVAIALESVTATVIDLYVSWKPGFRIKLEALLSSGLLAVGFEFNESTTGLQLESPVGGLSLTGDDIKLGSNDSVTQQQQLKLTVDLLDDLMGSVDVGIVSEIGCLDIARFVGCRFHTAVGFESLVGELEWIVVVAAVGINDSIPQEQQWTFATRRLELGAGFG